MERNIAPILGTFILCTLTFLLWSKHFIKNIILFESKEHLESCEGDFNIAVHRQATLKWIK